MGLAWTLSPRPLLWRPRPQASGCWPLTSLRCELPAAPAAPCRSLSETISEASYMKEALDIMPETLEYGILNSNILHFLRDIICQVRAGGGGAGAYKVEATESP